jgi:lipopolysaccharide heptosyltransferase II
MKILCVCPIGVGNYLLCYPAFRLLKKAAPDASLHLLALREGIAELARGDALWDGVTILDPAKIRKNFFAVFRTALKLRAQRFEASLNFFPSNTWQYSLLPWLLGIKKRFAFTYCLSGPLKLSFLSNYATPVNVALHDVRQNFLIVASYLGKEQEAPPIVFPRLFSEAERQWATLHMASLSLNKIRIGIHPGSSAEHGMDAKRWSPENFAGLADLAAQQTKGEVYIFGGPDEEPLKNRVAEALASKGHIMVPVSLRKTAALLKQCTLCICNDSGLMHMAACSGVPTVGIFGPTDEKRNGPVGEKNLVIRKNMQGFPIWTARSVGNRSLECGIDPQASLKALSVMDAWEQLRPWIVSIRG